MSAYASFPFTSYLSPTNANDETTSNVNTLHTNANGIMFKQQPEPEEEHHHHKSAIRVKIKSANVNVGVLTKPTRHRPRSPKSKSSKQQQKQSDSSFSLPDDAVIFKLSISYNGRKYNASRSFDKFVKLRNDLCRELNEVNNSYYSRQYRKYSHQSCNNTEEEATSILPQLPDSISDQTDGNCHFTLPSMSSSISMAMAAASVPHFNVGSGGITGFTKLQSLLLCYYCPLIECWLKRVMDIIDFDTSPCFNNFLWEPLRGDDDSSSSSAPSMSSSSHSNSTMEPQQHNSGVPSLRKKHSIGSALSLCSIHEHFEECS